MAATVYFAKLFSELIDDKSHDDESHWYEVVAYCGASQGHYENPGKKWDCKVE